MPTDPGVRLDNHPEGFSTRTDETTTRAPASRVRQWLGFQLVFLIEGQLLSQKQVLGYQRRSRPEYDRQEGDQVGNQSPSQSNESFSPPMARGILCDESLN
jgi:hypothetical protein